MKYKAGDRVKIKEDLSKCIDTAEEMMAWQGKNMTVKAECKTYYKMEEDFAKWAWNNDMIEGLAEPEVTNVEVLRLAVETYGEQDRMQACVRSLDRLSEALGQCQYEIPPTSKHSLMEDVAEACLNLTQVRMMLDEKEITESILRKTEQLRADLEDEREVMVVHGRHKINGRIYAWINPDGLRVEIGGIANAETSKGTAPVIVVNVGKEKFKHVKHHKKIVGVFKDE